MKRYEILPVDVEESMTYQIVPSEEGEFVRYKDVEKGKCFSFIKNELYNKNEDRYFDGMKHMER